MPTPSQFGLRGPVASTEGILVTTAPNELMEPLYNRMPVILAPQDYERWLAPVDQAHLPVDLLRPFAADAMTAWKVNKAVGNVKNNDPDLVAPI